MAKRHRGNLGKRKQGVTLLDELTGAPWLPIFVVGVLVFVGLVWILPGLAPGNLILNSIFQGVAAVAWVVFVIFLLSCAVFYAMAAASGSKRPTAKAGSGDAGRGSASRRLSAEAPAAAPRVREEAVTAASPAVEANPAVAMDEQEEARDIHDAWNGHAAEMETKPTAWSLDVLRDVEWKRFADLCQKFYEASGIRSETTAPGSDAGMDILLYQDDTGKPTAIAQCPGWGERLVGVKPMRELLGVMTHEKIGKAFFLTSGHFADAAKVVARSNRITLIDGEMLLMMIRRLPEAARKTLLEFATEGDYKTPTCPSCGIRMKPVAGKSGSSDFWACHNYPRCQQRLGMQPEASRQVPNR